MSTADVMSRMGMFVFVWGKTPPTADSMAQLARHAEHHGLDSIHVPWHMTLADSFSWENRYNLDPLVALPFIAARTERIGIGLNPFTLSAHHPFHWAQYLSSLDAASSGRAIAGLSKLFAPEDAQVGHARLQDADTDLDDGLRILTGLFRGTRFGPAEGRWNLDGLRLEPAPARPIPIWISGGDEIAIERAARYGDVLKPVGLRPDEYAQRVRPDLDAAARKYGRNVRLSSSVVLYVRTSEDRPDWVDEHVMPLVRQRIHGGEVHDGVLVGSPDECASKISALFAAGVDHLLLDAYFHGWESESFGAEQISRLSELVAPNVELAGD